MMSFDIHEIQARGLSFQEQINVLQSRRAGRTERQDDAVQPSDEGLTVEEAFRRTAYMDGALGHIESLRYGTAFPDLASLAGTGTSIDEDASQEPPSSQAPAAPQPSATDAQRTGAAMVAGPAGLAALEAPQPLPFTRNTDDNSENREIKARYATLQRLVTSGDPDFGPSRILERKHENGETRILELSEELTSQAQLAQVMTGSTGSGLDPFQGHAHRSFIRSDDGNRMSYYDSSKKYAIFRDGSKIEYRDLYRETKTIYTVDARGNVTEQEQDREGKTIRTTVAASDGSTRHLNARGEVTETRPADPSMADYGKIVDRLASFKDNSGGTRALTEEQRYNLTAALSRYDLKTLEALEKQGVRIDVLDHTGPQAPGGWPRTARGLYQEREKRITLRETDLGGGGSLSGLGTARHEMAHALDDMLVPDQDRNSPLSATTNDPALRKIYDDYKRRTGLMNTADMMNMGMSTGGGGAESLGQGDRSLVWSDYAAKDPSEYFAEGTRLYLGSDRERETLKKLDPGLYSYVEKLLARARGN
ncbi:MAG: hypothetical protein RDV48_27520 [Candidatus Eremiobacteraeota bacterium]|nr:hypothetical protein [Candidatus Eremiobacteraeota bacterium]